MFFGSGFFWAEAVEFSIAVEKIACITWQWSNLESLEETAESRIFFWGFETYKS